MITSATSSTLPFFLSFFFDYLLYPSSPRGLALENLVISTVCSCWLLHFHHSFSVGCSSRAGRGLPRRKGFARFDRSRGSRPPVSGVGWHGDRKLLWHHCIETRCNAFPLSPSNSIENFFLAALLLTALKAVLYWESIGAVMHRSQHSTSALSRNILQKYLTMCTKKQWLCAHPPWFVWFAQLVEHSCRGNFAFCQHLSHAFRRQLAGVAVQPRL